ncbi:agamous-like MADS-box protein AGL29 [Panicum virgatum]|jgi:DNA repair exonuclease SbcCD ATPase subunit|uniref:agamous-like MADS-box protein AGL29 n=1 Tax=Panicum virgatum TaxID=38727 RepID=UPI0019D59179|nr:agamous-like MADS-box protein AGL29 [Panicum virgatum]
MEMAKGKKSKGRKKTEIKPIENETARQVRFSKRRQGLFKKASELSILCGAMVAAVVFSASGRSFSFGHPSFDDVVNRFLSPVPTDAPAPGGNEEGSMTDAVRRLNMEYLELEQSLEAEEKRKERLQEATEKLMGERVMQWLNANIFELGLDELQEFQKKLEEIHVIVKQKVDEVMVEGRQTPRSLPHPPMEMASTSQSAYPNPYGFDLPECLSQSYGFDLPECQSQSYGFLISSEFEPCTD